MRNHNLLDDIRGKPGPAKQFIMWAGVISAMILIFLFWIFTFPSQIPSTQEDAATANLKNSLPSAFDSLKSQAGQLFNLFK